MPSQEVAPPLWSPEGPSSEGTQEGVGPALHRLRKNGPRDKGGRTFQKVQSKYIGDIEEIFVSNSLKW